MKTFIFGAGASVHAGYPLASELWPRIKQWVELTFPPETPFANAIKTVESEFDCSQPFELVLTDLQERIDTLLKGRTTPHDNVEERVRFVYTGVAVAALIPQFFNTIRLRPAGLYAAFAEELLTEGDAIITFNYDLAIDRELRYVGRWSIGDGYGFEVNVKKYGASPCLLLKLHGSTNWRGEVFSGVEGFGQTMMPPLGARPVIDKSEFEFLSYRDGSDPLCHDGRVRVETLIMPTAKKRFYRETSFGREWEGFWDQLWDQAASCLNRSDEIYLIGYSAPEYDTRARSLLRKAIRRDVVVKVCCHLGTDVVVKELRELGIDRCRSAEEVTFEGLLGRSA